MVDITTLADGTLICFSITDGKPSLELLPIIPMGAPGLSAYQIAVSNGFVGTESQWLDSLHAPNINVPKLDALQLQVDALQENVITKTNLPTALQSVLSISDSAGKQLF